jgi:hypothetical protein
MNRDEAIKLKSDLDAQGREAHVVTFDDGECGVSIQTKKGLFVGIDRTEDLEKGLEMVEQLS